MIHWTSLYAVKRLGTLKLKKQVWTELPPSICGGCAFLRASSCCTALEWGAAEGDTPHPRSAAAAVRRDPNSKVSSGSCEETPHIQGKKQQRNRQMWPWITEWSRAKDNRVLRRESTGHNKHDLPTTQEKTLYMTSPDGQHRYQIDYILWSQRWRSSIQSAKTRPGADCGSDHELIAKFRLKLKKVGITTR